MEIEVSGIGKSIQSVQHTPKKKKELSEYNLFVRQEAGPVRAKLTREWHRQEDVLKTAVTQSEVMKECSRLWREKKLVPPLSVRHES